MNEILGPLVATNQFQPQVSIIIPSFNEPIEIIGQSLASVVRQSYRDFECIVIDESTDFNLAEACKTECERDNRFKYVRPDCRIGLAASLNLGISMAKGRYIARFDSDDICVDDRLESQVRFLDDQPTIGVLGGGLEIIDEFGKTLAYRDYPQEHQLIARKFQTNTPIAHPTVMIRKELFDLYGAYDPSFRYSEDLDLWLRLLSKGVRFANLNQTLVRYRQQQTFRNSRHWRFNLRARINNFELTHLPNRLFGICAIASWSCLPSSVQEWIFRRLLLRSR